MSCGNPHDVPCTDVLLQVYSYLDGELDSSGYAKIRQHLDECAPCLREFGLEEMIKQLVHRCGGSEAVPAQLRSKVLTRIQEIRVSLEVTETTTEVEVRAEIEARAEFETRAE